ncbi:MAG: bifunctional diaminohydroxyphosphoribosylaminopyrimidine deaminase/5-amino-6-(5-phosphoribosylamino)uracil reductase RibD [Eubacteriales bacterium]|nr:bifunctional diaminohydroxyphosphoribosylaminopyrimidine deaminase/5-amino-6-(5-phosphoribosylamino)uracil reductase RibD [Eubacteriales bacterium]
MLDTEYMRRALRLAERGRGRTAPNPMVGAVVVKDGQVIGEGWHERCGQPHAERNVLAACTQSPAGATMYVTLEPCDHHGRQPPCVDAILEAGIARVVVGAGDPNPHVDGKGIARLRAHGVQVTEHVLEQACIDLNTVFFHYIRTHTPYVVMKYAMTLDGKIAAYTGASRWVTGEAARRHVHAQRDRYTAIMVGVGTVQADDPQLTCRLPGGRDPIRIICDSQLRVPLTAQVVRTAHDTPTWIATCCTDRARIARYEQAGCRVLTVPAHEARVDLRALMQVLGREEIDSILLEGGGTLHWSALESGIVQRVQAYIAPKLFGGREAKTPVEGAGVPDPSAAFLLKNSTVTRLGEDILIESEVEPHVHGDR